MKPGNRFLLLIFAAFIQTLLFPAATAQQVLTTKSLAAGSSHSMALRSDGTVWTYGTNNSGELGQGSTPLSLSPRRVQGLPVIAGISAGPLHSLAVGTNGTVWAWGTNGSGRLGNGTSTTASTAVQSTGITTGTAVSAGVGHSLALLSNGRVMVWGANESGQLGTGNTNALNVPTLLGTPSSVTAIAAGSNYSVALTANGEVWSWGANAVGQLGLGNTNSQLSPIKIGTLSGIAAIAAGHTHALALGSNGVVYAWGRNAEGQIGDGTTGNSLSPKAMTTTGTGNALGAVQAIAANFNSSAALSAKGRIAYWGSFNDGYSVQTTAVPIILGSVITDSFSLLSCGNGFHLAGQVDGSVWVWGSNLFGQWGTGEYIQDAWTGRGYNAYNPVFAFSSHPKSTATRFNRGYGANKNLNSFLLPLDLEDGVRLGLQDTEQYFYGSGAPWFLRVAKNLRQHSLIADAGTNFVRVAVENPIAAYGADAGASKLFVGDSYTFGVYSGMYDESTGDTNLIRILVYDRSAFVNGATNVTPVNTINIGIPRRSITADAANWSLFIQNGHQSVSEASGLRTTIEVSSGDGYTGDWGTSWLPAGGGNWLVVPNVTLGGYRLTHTATSTNYCYIVEGKGKVQHSGNTVQPMATNSAGWATVPLYAMSFENKSAQAPRFVDQLFFESTPLPSLYAGRRLDDLSNPALILTTTASLTNDAAYLTLDASPELRQHPLLDKLVDDLGKDPLQLASYVINEIELTDPMSLLEFGKKVNDSIEIGGVNRSATGVFLEGQGSPTEQCALLVYLLRKAGYSAGYVFPTNSNLRLTDSYLSQLFRMPVKGMSYYGGMPVITNGMIVVNYPWVIANVGTNTVQIFPWLKDHEIVEGRDIYDYMPNNYKTGVEFTKDFLNGKPELMALAPTATSTAMDYFKAYLTQMLSTNTITPNVSLDQFGVRSFNRRHVFAGWDALPKPTVLTNESQNIVVPSLSASPVTYPFLSNIFDHIQVQVFQTTTATNNLILDTGNWRICDMLNRKFLLYSTAATNVTLYMESYRPGVAGTDNFAGFDTSSSVVKGQSLQALVGSGITSLPMIYTYKRRASTLTQPWYTIPMVEVATWYTTTFAKKADVTAINMHIGRVTPAMVQKVAEQYWKTERARAQNPSTVVDVVDSTGTAAFLVGMDMMAQMSENDDWASRLHKNVGFFAQGFGHVGITPLASGKMQIDIDYQAGTSMVIGNGQLNQSSGDFSQHTAMNYLPIAQLARESAEHAVFGKMFSDPNPLSAVRVLQVAGDNARNSGYAPVLDVNVKNYQTIAGTIQTGYGNRPASSNPALWSYIYDVYGAYAGQFLDKETNFMRAFVTPGAISIPSAGYVGAAAFFCGSLSSGSVLTFGANLLHGGLSSWDLDYLTTPDFSSYELSHSLKMEPGNGYSFVRNDFSTPSVHFDFSTLDYLAMTMNSGVSRPQFVFTPQQGIEGGMSVKALNLPGGTSTEVGQRTGEDVGFFGKVSASVQQAKTLVVDPVQVVTGEFYVDATDLRLPGPFPLELRRNYLSGNPGDSGLGHGWKLSLMPWLVRTTNSAGDKLILAAEMDGSIIAYRWKVNHLWTVRQEDNPGLVNYTEAGIGSTANRFNNTITDSSTSGLVYVLTGADGSRRTYQEMNSFPLTSGTNQMARIRPYLTRWEDHAGNFYAFSYGSSSTENDYGQLNKVRSGNGAALSLKYDYNGRVTEVIANDGRRVRYTYDNYGDLTQATLPDNSEAKYKYQHYSFTNSIPYTDSNHLLIDELKPDGRELVNAYDSLRRVLTQASTVGINRLLVTNAWFFYTNNVALWTDDSITGSTRVEDCFHNATTYTYTSNLVTRIDYPLSRTVLQDWFDGSETAKAGYYQRSLEQVTDERGLINQFTYDASGNLTQLVWKGDLTGNGITTETAANTVTFNGNNLPVTARNAVGNGLNFYYEDGADLFRPTRVLQIGASTAIATNTITYGNLSEIIVPGTWTNQVFGLRTQLVQADIATNQWLYNSRGFLTQSIAFAQTAELITNTDPAVTISYTNTPQGQVAQRTDAAGRKTKFGYDAAGRTLWRDVMDETGAIVIRENFYYNRNGELEWYDGPASNPDDFAYFDYDGAGRKVEEVRWRARARADGSGVEAETDDNLYATTTYRYDPFGNMVSAMNPRGVVTTNVYDALGEVVTSSVLSFGGASLASQGFTYEPGGLVSSQTNPLGGVDQTQYTSTGLPKYRKTADNSVINWRYDLAGRLVKQTFSNGSFWQTTYADATRLVTSVFKNTGSTTLASMVTEFDRRGNVFRTQDALGNNFTNWFDGLNRLKLSAGPVTIAINPPGFTFPPPPTNGVQQVVILLYDASGAVTVRSNTLAESTTTRRDALGRTTSLEVRQGATLLRHVATSYSADQHGMVVTEGDGADAITSYSFFDNDGNNVLSAGYPASSTMEYSINQFDVANNPVSARRFSNKSGAVTLWQSQTNTFDELNRVATHKELDDALTTFQYNALGNTTYRSNGVIWRATYNTAGQMLTEWDADTVGATARSSSYAYFGSGNGFAGLPSTSTDARGVTCTYAYDDWLQTASKTYTGSNNEYKMTTAFTYDARGSMTTVAESFLSGTTGPSTTVDRSYDAYGLLSGENVKIGTSILSGTSIQYDSAGRRVGLGFGSFGYKYTWRADNLLTGSSGPNGGGTYSYNTAGLLAGRTVGPKAVAVTQRDGLGRLLGQTTTIDVNTLVEAMAYTGDGLISTHTVAWSDFSDNRSYVYGNLTRRLTEERTAVNPTTIWTNVFQYDNGSAAGPGVLTRLAQPDAGGASLTSGPDTFSRINKETNSVAKRLMYGRVNSTNGFSTTRIMLDGTPQTVASVGTSDSNWPTQWRADLELRPGMHTLQAAAVHPSGQYQSTKTITFTNSAADQTSITYDAQGQVSGRTWKNAALATIRQQNFTWDGRGRLLALTERSGTSLNDGYNWSAVYDALGRRLQQTTTIVTNGTVLTAQAKSIKSYFDPQVEFMELGVVENGRPSWKLYGPDLNGEYGGLNGTGGFDAIVPDVDLFCPVVGDARGNMLAVYDQAHAMITRFLSRPTAYGAVPGYRPAALGNGAKVEDSSAWRGRWPDISGLVWLGARYYDPQEGRFLSADPYGHAGSPSLYDFANGDPVNNFDPDGRLGKGQYVALNPSTGYVQRYSAYDAFYLGNAAAWAGKTADRNYALYQGPITDRPIASFGDSSFRMLFGDQSAAFAEAAVMLDVGAVLAVPNAYLDVRDSSQLAGTASVVGSFGDKSFAYTQAGVAVASAFIVFEKPVSLLREGVSKRAGSGPSKSFLEISDSFKSSKAVQNFGSPKPTDFIFDTKSQRFILGRGPHGHDSVLQAGQISPHNGVVGGRIRRQNGSLISDEWSGHYGQNWTPEIREQFQNFMKQHGVTIKHVPWAP